MDALREVCLAVIVVLCVTGEFIGIPRRDAEFLKRCAVLTLAIVFAFDVIDSHWLLAASVVLLAMPSFFLDTYRRRRNSHPSGLE